MKNNDEDEARFEAEDVEVDAAVKRLRVMCSDQRDVAHALIRSGLAHLRATLCDEHVIEELEYVRDWIVERIEITRAGGQQ